MHSGMAILSSLELALVEAAEVFGYTFNQTSATVIGPLAELAVFGSLVNVDLWFKKKPFNRHLLRGYHKNGHFKFCWTLTTAQKTCLLLAPAKVFWLCSARILFIKRRS